jgi:transcriptional regulator with XRE-family HTH domain
MSLAENLKKLIKRKHLNTLELSRLIGIGQPVIYRIMTGETEDPKISTVLALASYFGITVNQLIGHECFPQQSKSESKVDVFEIPLLNIDQIVNWPDIDLTENNAKVMTDYHPANKFFYAFKVKDDAMSPLFPKGTVLIIDGNKKPKNRSYVIAKLESEKTILFRQLLKDDKIQYLKPLNPDGEKYKIKFFNDKTDRFLGVLVQATIDFND